MSNEQKPQEPSEATGDTGIWTTEGWTPEEEAEIAAYFRDLAAKMEQVQNKGHTGEAGRVWSADEVRVLGETAKGA